MNVLVACEFSGIVRDAFIKRGHNAVSVDLLPSESDKGRHIQGDIKDMSMDEWDLMIAHPPCEYLTVTANRSFVNNLDRWEKRLDAMRFVHFLMNVPIDQICIENPVGVISTHIRKPDQYIQPYEYGHPMTKKTGLWLKNLSLLKPTKIVSPEYVICESSGKRYSPMQFYSSSTDNPRVQQDRSRTFQGIADAMAEQWGDDR